MDLDPTVERRPLLRSLLAFCLFEMAFYLAYRYGMSFSSTTPSPFWFPDSVLLCALLLAPPRAWWLLLLATLPIRLLVGVPPATPAWFLLSTFAIDCTKALLAATLLRRYTHNPTRFESPRDFGLYFVIVVALVPALAAVGGAAARHALGYDYWQSWQQWFSGDALASLIVTPFIFYWLLPPLPIGLRRLGASWAEPILLVCGLLASSWLAFGPATTGLDFTESRFYVPVPFLFWAAIRFGVFGASGAVALLSFAAVTAALFGRGPFTGSTPANTAAHLQYFLVLRAAPLYIVAVLIEHTQRIEHSLRETERRFRVMADTAPVLIWMSGTDGQCDFFNKGWLDFTGRTALQERGSGWTAGVHPEDYRDCLATYESSFAARIPFEMDYRLRRHDGEYRWIIDKGVPRYAANGDFLGYIGSAIDITDRKHAEEADRNLSHTARLAALGELSAMIAHEINQPLCAILSNAEAGESLVQSPQPPLGEIRQIFADICSDDRRADEAIRRIRAMTQKREMRLQPTSVNDTVAGVLRLVAGDALRRRVDIRPELAADLPQVSADRAYLEQVLLNLIVNGMDAMDETREPARQLTIQTKLNGGDSVEVSVMDSGSGIPEAGMAHLFDTFFTTKANGTGLGLSIARSIIHAHQGRIWAENRTTGGAALRFALPATVARSAPNIGGNS